MQNPDEFKLGTKCMAEPNLNRLAGGRKTTACGRGNPSATSALPLFPGMMHLRSRRSASWGTAPVRQLAPDIGAAPSSGALANVQARPHGRRRVGPRRLGAHRHRCRRGGFSSDRLKELFRVGASWAALKLLMARRLDTTANDTNSDLVFMDRLSNAPEFFPVRP